MKEFIVYLCCLIINAMCPFNPLKYSALTSFDNVYKDFCEEMAIEYKDENCLKFFETKEYKKLWNAYIRRDFSKIMVILKNHGGIPARKPLNLNFKNELSLKII